MIRSKNMSSANKSLDKQPALPGVADHGIPSQHPKIVGDDVSGGVGDCDGARQAVHPRFEHDPRIRGQRSDDVAGSVDHRGAR